MNVCEGMLPSLVSGSDGEEWQVDENQDQPPLRGRARRGPGELEASVLAALVGAPGPVTAGWVRERIDPALAYTTVVTTLTRLHGKQAVVRHRDGRSYVWSAVFDPAGLAARRMHQVLNKESDRGAVLSRFVAELPPDDERSLRLKLGATKNAGTAS